MPMLKLGYALANHILCHHILNWTDPFQTQVWLLGAQEISTQEISDGGKVFLYSGSWEPVQIVDQYPKDHLSSQGEAKGFLKGRCEKRRGFTWRRIRWPGG